jgi:hypothetical protein
MHALSAAAFRWVVLPRHNLSSICMPLTLLVGGCSQCDGEELRIMNKQCWLSAAVAKRASDANVHAASKVLGCSVAEVYSRA